MRGHFNSLAVHAARQKDTYTRIPLTRRREISASRLDNHRGTPHDRSVSDLFDEETPTTKPPVQRTRRRGFLGTAVKIAGGAGVALAGGVTIARNIEPAMAKWYEVTGDPRFFQAKARELFSSPPPNAPLLSDISIATVFPAENIYKQQYIKGATLRAAPIISGNAIGETQAIPRGTRLPEGYIIEDGFDEVIGDNRWFVFPLAQLLKENPTIKIDRSKIPAGTEFTFIHLANTSVWGTEKITHITPIRWRHLPSARP